MHYYIHIPFCRQKCPYCKFALTPIFDDAKKRRYLAHLQDEIRAFFFSSPRDLFEDRVGNQANSNLFSKGKRDFSAPLQNDNTEIRTIYFGGGTPSVLTLKEINEILSCFPDRENAEISFECNPEDVTVEYVEGLLRLGIGRLSLGIQSLNNTTLTTIHRSDRDSIFEALDAINSSLLSFRGTRNLFQNQVGEKDTQNLFNRQKRDFSALLRNNKKESSISINIDFILGLPHSSSGETLSNIREIHTKFPFVTHTSVYMLEEGEYPKNWKKLSITEGDMEREYSEICRYFESLGWQHYEISSWARPGYECVHNQGYWNHSNTRGFGLSATSYIDRMRSTNSTSFSGYYRGELDQEEILTQDEVSLEKIIHDLRTFRLDISLFPEKKRIIESLKAKDLITIKNDKIILTPTGIFRENTILSELI